jgi:beta-galactosidase
MAHLLSYWTWPLRIGQITPVHVFTSGDAAELFLNGKSLGRKAKGRYEYRLRLDNVKYQPGELEVVIYNQGKEWASDVVRTAGSPAKLLVKVDQSTIAADGQGLSFITIKIIDKDDVLVPRAENRIRFSVDGLGEIGATDNGDPTSFESFQFRQCDAFYGLCLAIVGAKPDQTGTIILKAESIGLTAATVTICSQGE